VPTRDLADLTWEEMRRVAGSRTVAILPVGAIEAHGPHLPLGTDVIIAEAWARAAAARLAASGCEVLRLPPLAYTPAPYGRGFAGTISVSPAAVTALVTDLTAELGRYGVLAVGIANAHLDPANRQALGDAVIRRGAAGGVPALVFPDITHQPWALRLGQEFQSGACHAGRFEASIVLAARPDLVRDRIRRELPPNPASLSDAIREGKRTFEEAGGARAYFGWPADATAEEGRAHLDALGEILADAVLEALAPEPAA
jgi:creatinine amidohydrolase